MLNLFHNEDGTGQVTEQNPLQTKHTNSGEAQTISAYIVNDGKRYGVDNDSNPPALIYSNISVRIEGVSYTLEESLTASTSDVTVKFTGVDGWNIGTIVKLGTERLRIEELLSSQTVRVTRNYTADGGSSSISNHNIGETGISETTTISLATPSPTDYSQPSTFLNGGESLTTGFDPTSLVATINNLETTNIIRSTDASKYAIGSLIKIDNEIMKVTNVSGNELTVLRGYNGSQRASHQANATIYLVGIVDVGIAHKVFIKNDPPAGLVTSKRRDIKITIVADEEEL